MMSSTSGLYSRHHPAVLGDGGLAKVQQKG